MAKQKIISGSFSYVARQSRIWDAMGYRIVKQKHWPDNKWTFVMERITFWNLWRTNMTTIISEDQLEIIYERHMDKLDRMYTKGILSNDEYAEEVRELDNWMLDQERKSRARQYREW